MKKFKFTIDGSKYEVSVNEVEPNIAEIEVNGTPFTVKIDREERKPVSPLKKTAGKVAPVATPAKVVASSIIKSQLPGSIIEIKVAVGQRVTRGDIIMTIESMKMENNIIAENDGVVKRIMVTPGQNVMQGDSLIEMEGTQENAAAAKPIVEEAKPVASKPAPAVAKPGSIKAPLPGSSVKIVAKEGQAIKRGELLFTMESMKMENNILAEKDCTVRKIHVKEGQNVMQDDLLVDIE